MTLDVSVLVSAGRHPVSGRARRAPDDARALELALILTEQYGGRVQVLHAGDPENPALRDYLGMGIPELQVVTLPAGVDIVPALTETLRKRRPDLILTGVRAEAGWSSGCLPYSLAETLGYELAPNIDSVSMDPDPGGDGRIDLRQVCPRGRRRILRARLPVLVTVDPAAPTPRQSAFARARGGRIIRESWTGPAVAAPGIGEARPARRRPRRLRAATNGSSADQRLQALTGSAGSHGQPVEADNADEAAKRILAYLVENGLIESRDKDRPHK